MKRVSGPVIVLLMLALAAACRREAPQAVVRAERPNVLLVTIDTLRADHLGCYGRQIAETPTLDGLATRGVRFETAIAPAPLTGPSHASILTGRNPLGHGFRNNSGFVLAPTVSTLAEAFREGGYRTGAFVSGFPLDRRFGFDRGFQVYDDHLPRGNDRRRTPYVERNADDTTRAALGWLGPQRAPAGGQGPWFLWVHYYDPHAPYEPPAVDLAERFRATPYDGEIAFVDRQLGRLLQALGERAETDRTLVLVTSDHGESLGEHGEATHGIFIYDATIRVPWVMAGPGVGAGRVPRTVVRSIDVAPTLLDYAGLAPRKSVDGRSVRPAADGREMPDAPSYSESLYAEMELGWAPVHAWRTAGFKLIETTRPELYDLSQDPSETVNRFGDQPARAADLRRGLAAALRQRPPSNAAAPVDASTMERLKSLGYVSGPGGSPRRGGVLRDAKDGVHLLRPLNRGMSAARADPELAIRELTTVLNEDPGLLMARRTRAVAFAAAGRHELAVADLRQLEQDGLLTPEDAIVLGDNLRSVGRTAEASTVLERVARENPKFAQPLLSLAEVRIQEGKHAEATELCERVLKLVPDQIEALRRLGDLALLRGDLGAADARYSRILALDPADVPAMTKLGVVSMRSGRGDRAMNLFRQVLQHDPKNGEALLYLAGALASGGRPADALPYFERALNAGPRSTMALNGLGLTRLATGDRSGAAAAFRESLRLDPKQEDVSRTLAELQPPKR
jgi:choline-sulfatase